MSIFKALAVKDVDEATRAIPLIDVGPAFRAEPGALEGAARDVRRACETVGFFYLAGHGVPQTLIDAAFADPACFTRCRSNRSSGSRSTRTISDTSP